jgi:uncharacterized protein YihD (DUF1040 family)
MPEKSGSEMINAARPGLGKDRDLELINIVRKMADKFGGIYLKLAY